MLHTDVQACLGTCLRLLSAGSTVARVSDFLYTAICIACTCVGQFNCNRYTTCNIEYPSSSLIAAVQGTSHYLLAQPSYGKTGLYQAYIQMLLHCCLHACTHDCAQDLWIESAEGMHTHASPQVSQQQAARVVNHNTHNHNPVLCPGPILPEVSAAAYQSSAPQVEQACWHRQAPPTGFRCTCTAAGYRSCSRAKPTAWPRNCPCIKGICSPYCCPP